MLQAADTCSMYAAAVKWHGTRAHHSTWTTKGNKRCLYNEFPNTGKLCNLNKGKVILLVLHVENKLKPQQRTLCS